MSPINIFTYVQIIVMRACFPQDNPYQVKNKRFRRTANEMESPCQVSVEKVKGLIGVKSSIDLKSAGKDYEVFGQYKMKSEIVPKGIGKDVEVERAGTSLEKRQIKRRKDQQGQNDNKQKEAFLHIIAEQKKCIQTLQRLLNSKENHVKELEIKLFQYQKIQEQGRRLQDELTKTQALHDQETYRLKQALKKLEIEINCTNRKWSLDFEKMMKEKDQECKQLRQKYTSLLRSKRLASKQSSVLSQNPTLTGFPQANKPGDQILDFSSFELSKDQGPNP